MDKKHNIYFSLDDKYYDLLKLLAEKKDLRMTVLARHIIRDYLDKIEDSDIILNGE